MGRKKLSEYSPEVAARMRADLARKMREAWARREKNKFGDRKNDASQPDTQQKISGAIRRKWEDGNYADRINGMIGKYAAKHPNWTWGKLEFASILKQHEKPQCAFCGRKTSLNAHHIDENHDNYLLTNLQWTCVPCHGHRYHYGDRSTRKKTPFITLGKRFAFEYAHILPWHPGKCARLHGHSGHLEVKIRARVDPNGIVEDFYDVSSAVKMAVVDHLDHKFLNDYLPNPTSEELLIYIWFRLQSIGLKGLHEVTFSETDSSFATLTATDLVESYGWDKDQKGKWIFVRKDEAVRNILDSSKD